MIEIVLTNHPQGDYMMVIHCDDRTFFLNRAEAFELYEKLRAKLPEMAVVE